MKNLTLVLPILLLFCFCIETVAQESPAPPTRITDAMIEHPVRPEAAFYIVTPSGREWVVPDETIVIDFETSPPTVRAVCAIPPPPITLTEVAQIEVLTAPKYIYALNHIPVLERLLKVYRNGLKLAEGVDYVRDLTSVTIAETTGTEALDKIQIMYFVAGDIEIVEGLSLFSGEAPLYTSCLLAGPKK